MLASTLPTAMDPTWGGGDSCGQIVAAYTGPATSAKTACPITIPIEVIVLKPVIAIVSGRAIARFPLPVGQPVRERRSG